tara:strand:+ start:497 stop:643 length:147 start_codon:yes stop_codon:yes gene_type:complete
MIEIIMKLFSSYFNSSKAENHNDWTLMIGIISCMGAYAITGQIIPEFF